MGYDSQSYHVSVKPRHYLFLEWSDGPNPSDLLQQVVDERLAEQGIDPERFATELEKLSQVEEIDAWENLDGYEEFSREFFNRVQIES